MTHVHVRRAPFFWFTYMYQGDQACAELGSVDVGAMVEVVR